MNGVEQAAAVVGLISIVIGLFKPLRHAAWEVLCAPYRLGQILEELKNSRSANERSADASERALDEWKGATRAVRELAGGHGGRLDAHDRTLNDHEHRIAQLEGIQQGAHP